jgi:chaperonin GroEL
MPGAQRPEYQLSSKNNDMNQELLLNPQQKFLDAFNKWAPVVISTMGAGGRNVIFGDNKRFPRITWDGVTVTRFLDPDDPVEQVVVRLMVDAAEKVVNKVGDGTTTTTLLLWNVYEEALKELPETGPRQEFFKGMQEAVARVKEYVNEIKHELPSEIELKGEDGEATHDFRNIRSISRISTHGNNELADMIAELAVNVGRDGVIFVKDSHSPRSYTQHIDGYTMDGGLIAPEFVNNSRDNTCVLDNPLVVLIKEKVSDRDFIVKIVDHYFKEVLNGEPSAPRQPIVFVVEDMEGSALGTVVKNLPGRDPRGANIPMAVVKAPSSGFRMERFLEDLQAVTGTRRIFNKLKGDDLRTFGEDVFEHGIEFGRVDHFVASRDRSVFYTDPEREEAIKEHTDDLREQLAKEKDDTQIEILQDRIARLTSGIGIVYVGGDSDTEHQTVVDSADDASKACLSAMRHGVVPGGGVTLLGATKRNYELPVRSGKDFVKGFSSVMRSLVTPFVSIMQNAGHDVVAQEAPSDDDTIDAMTGKTVNAFDAGILDPAEAPVLALEKAVSVAIRLLDTGYLLTKTDT